MRLTGRDKAHSPLPFTNLELLLELGLRRVVYGHKTHAQYQALMYEMKPKLGVPSSDLTFSIVG